MSTRSKISFIRKLLGKREHLVSVYQHYDGYISGVGHELAEFILSKRLCNGIPVGEPTDDLANGYECLIAQYIRVFKEGVGGLYITTQNDNQEYNYDVIFNEDIFYNESSDIDEYFTITVYNSNDKIIFEGSPRELLNFKEKEIL